MGENIFYREVPTRDGIKEFKNGSRLAKEKISNHPSSMKVAYRKAKTLLEKDLDSLSLAEKGYVSRVVESKLHRKGGVLDAYNLCLDAGIISEIPDEEIENNLIKDAANGNKDYMTLVKAFIDENEIGKSNVLEMMVSEAGRKTKAFGNISKTSIVMVLSGFLFSSYNITGNVVGSSVGSGKLVGALLFTVGLIWMTISIKAETAKCH